MPNETELERIVVRLLGDGENHADMWKSAERTAAESSRGIEGSVARGVLGAHALEMAGHALVETIHEVIEAFEQQEAAEIALEATLKAHGRDVGNLMQEYSGFAAGIQATTTLADEQVLMLAKQAESSVASIDVARDAMVRGHQD